MKARFTTPLLLLGFAGLGLAALWPDDHDIRIYDQHWSLRQNQCEVTFSATNQRASEVTRQVRMLVLAQHWPVGGDVVVSKTIGEKVIALRLRPHETRSVTELVSLLPGAKPWIVNVTDFPAPTDATAAPD